MLPASEMVHVDHLSPSPFFPSLLSPPHTLSLASSLLCLYGSQGRGRGMWGCVSLILSYPELSSASVQLGALARFVTSEQLPTEQKNPVRRRCLETPHPSPTRLLLYRP